MATVPPPPKVLASGTYIITQVATGLKVSRALAEDKSLGPKRVVLVKPAEASVWDVTRNRDGTYILKNRNAPAVKIDGKLFAELTPASPPLEKRWRLYSVEHQGADQWVVETADQREGWLIDGNIKAPGPYTQVSVAPLLVFLSLPPQYPANERFHFERVYV